MPIRTGILEGAASSGGGTSLNPASFTANPSSLSLGTSSSGFIDVSSDRLTGFSVSLSGTIASVASVQTELGSAIGGCSSSAGQECRVTVTRSSGTAGSNYSGNIVLTDESGNTQNVAVELDVPDILRATAETQGAKYIWAMDTSGTSQPNYGDGGTLALTLTSARATTAQGGVEGRFPLTDAVNARASVSVEATSNMSIVVCVNLTEITATRAIFSGNNFGNNANPGYIAITSGSALAYRTYNLGSTVVVEASPTTGVWLLALTVNSSGGANLYARKVGSSLVSQSFNRGAAVGGTDTYILGGNGSNYYSAPGDYFFFAIYDSVIGTTEFNELYDSIG